jgi:probable F420-dependent oxidoreductase
LLGNLAAMLANRRLGITIPFAAPLAEHGEPLRRLAAAGYTDFWTAETAGADAFTPLAGAAPLLPRARLGTAIASVFTRGPALLAMSAAALAESAPGRFALGLGAASPAIVSDWNGLPFERPLSRVRDTVRFLRAALAGERVEAEYETFAVRGFRLERAPAEPPPILLGALRPKMLALAGAEADGAILNWLAASDVPTAAAHVRAHGEREIAARIFVCPSTDTEAVRAGARRLVAAYLTVPAYAAYQRWLGREEQLAPLWERWERGERREAAASVPDEVVDALFVHGAPERCAAGIAAYAESGVDTPILKLLPLDPAVDPLEGALAVAAACHKLGEKTGSTVPYA